MSQENNNITQEQSQAQQVRPLVDRSQARELSPEERLSPVDLEVLDEIYGRAIVKAGLLPQEGEEECLFHQMVVGAVKDDCGIGSKQFLDVVRWLNEKFPEHRILIPSEYGITPAEVEPPHWQIPGLVLRNGLTLFYGLPGSWKTIVIIYMGHALRTGTDFFGIPIDGNYRVLYLEQDESNSIFKDQVQKIGFPEDEFILCKLRAVWDGKGFNKEFHDSIKALRPDVVFVDSFTNLGITNINDGSSSNCLNALRVIAEENKIAIVVVHHEAKTTQGQSGSTLHVARVDSEIQISVATSMNEGNTEKVTLTQHKIRGDHFRPIILKANKRTLRLERELNMTIARLVREMQEEGLDRQTIISRFRGKDKDTARKALYRSRRSGTE